MSLIDCYIKRFFDILVSFLGVCVFSFVIFICWFVASVETKSNGFFFQKRIGRKGKLFHVVKIKTMREIDGINTTVTSASDLRITSSGAFFRRYKLDELPQLFNVILGQMSFVGPRPDVPGYADELRGSDRIILSVRPGITGPASIKYKGEEEILSRQKDPQLYNDSVIWPDKVEINKRYIQNYSLLSDINYIIKTVSN